jgi:hypothetical protein
MHLGHGLKSWCVRYSTRQQISMEANGLEEEEAYVVKSGDSAHAAAR